MRIGFCWLVVTCRTMSRQDMQRCSALTVSFHWVAVGNNPMIALLVHARTPSLNKVKPDPKGPLSGTNIFLRMLQT